MLRETFRILAVERAPPKKGFAELVEANVFFTFGLVVSVATFGFAAPALACCGLTVSLPSAALSLFTEGVELDTLTCNSVCVPSARAEFVLSFFLRGSLGPLAILLSSSISESLIRSSDLNFVSGALRFSTFVATPFFAMSLSLLTVIAVVGRSELVALLGFDEEDGFDVAFLLKICLALTSAAAPNLAVPLSSADIAAPDTESLPGELDLVDGRGRGVRDPGPVRLSLERVLPVPRSDTGRSFCQSLSSLDTR